ncbi:hypothetical protein ABNF97_14900 [Plantactinospora sp. B6F1]|uniref:hypothetical protein n=1 Tax=Plantactinospora sp. B6F1 TaxID=3158971 RepID=UPI0032D932F3
MSVGTDRERFREKVRVCLHAHEDHVALRKLRRNRQLTSTDLAELSSDTHHFLRALEPR